VVAATDAARIHREMLEPVYRETPATASQEAGNQSILLGVLIFNKE